MANSLVIHSQLLSELVGVQGLLSQHHNQSRAIASATIPSENPPNDPSDRG